ncbi:MAG: demethoxyubiquinone hydroxylase family protein [OM182 bacterium]|uniref:Demethoxyubiquinone hydroxylase family protein n=1 Tax=OM182 bacterium TaxID=2510334 RepID=A0A520RWR7_9GAMM|nr:MAG: demethoxyubiquinone hydroxylase family protein [OM182 bacterium]
MLKIDFSPQQLSLLRSDHAGELGAVNIYKGILWCARDPAVVAFANCHLEVESKHLASVESLLIPKHRSTLSPLWVVAGRALGLMAVVGGKNFLFSTIASVEEFVVEHYKQQLPFFSGTVQDLLKEMMADETTHREDAAHRSSRRHMLWEILVKKGCGLAVFASSKC